MRRDDRRGGSGNMKDQRYRDRDVRDRDRDRESRDRDRDRGDRERSNSNIVSTSTSNSNSKDRKSSTSSSRSTSAASASSSTRKSDENHKNKPEVKTPAGSSDEDEGFEPNMSAQELFEAVVNVENEEAKALDVDKHLKEFMTMCKHLEMLMDELYEMKLRGEAKTSVFSRKQVECLMLLTTVREMNRLYKLRLKIAKDNVSEQRQRVDADHLCLQNLIYEATHLNDQVSAVQDYKGIDEDIDLIPVDQFYKDAPPSITRDGATKSNPHLLKVARLEYEYAQRQNLTEKCVQLEKEQERVSAEILKRQAELSSIAPILEKILDAAKPLEELYQLDITGKRKMDQVARYLPTPLYTLYVSSVGYVDSLDGECDFKIKIAGDVEAAKKMITPVLAKPPLDEDLEDISPMEIDDEEVVEQEKEEEEVSSRRKLKKHLSIVEEKIDTRAKIVEKNPLHVEWILELPDGEIFTVTFYYIIRLNIVTITANVNMKTVPWKLASFLNKSEQIIADLFEDDDGEECPNLSADYTLRRADVETFSELIPEIGRPYKWAQKVCGLLFLPDDSEEVEQVSKTKAATKRKITVSKANVPGALSLLHVRITNKINLWKSLRSLESSKISLPLAVEECLPNRDAAATFSSMEPLEFGDFQAYECTKEAKLEHLARPCNLFLKFVMQRENRKLTAIVAVSQDFPDVPPGVALLLKEGDAELQELNGHPLRKIRKEVNCTVPQLFEGFPTHIFSIQLRALRDRLDNIPLDFEEVGVWSEGAGGVVPPATRGPIVAGYVQASAAAVVSFLFTVIDDSSAEIATGASELFCLDSDNSFEANSDRTMSPSPSSSSKSSIS